MPLKKKVCRKCWADERRRRNEEARVSRYQAEKRHSVLDRLYRDPSLGDTHADALQQAGAPAPNTLIAQALGISTGGSLLSTPNKSADVLGGVLVGNNPTPYSDDVGRSYTKLAEPKGPPNPLEDEDVEVFYKSGVMYCPHHLDSRRDTGVTEHTHVGLPPPPCCPFVHRVLHIDKEENDDGTDE